MKVWLSFDDTPREQATAQDSLAGAMRAYSQQCTNAPRPATVFIKYHPSQLPFGNYYLLTNEGAGVQRSGPWGPSYRRTPCTHENM